jgi:uncharacterized OsmC-like protein
MSIASINTALGSISDVIATNPDKARAKAAPATARLVDGLRCEVTGPKGETMHTDMPPAMGGNASAPNPGWFMRGAVASCTATVIAQRAARLGIALKLLEVSVESDSDHRGILGLDDRVSAGFSAMRVKVRIGADGVDPSQLRGLAEWGDAHSPVACTVRKSPVTSLDVEIV